MTGHERLPPIVTGLNRADTQEIRNQLVHAQKIGSWPLIQIVIEKIEQRQLERPAITPHWSDRD